jgi:hypothetical protein
MSDGLSSGGRGFPNDIQVGHLHYVIEEGLYYGYQGGNPKDSNNWVPVTGSNLAGIDAHTLVNVIPSTLQPTIVPFNIQQNIDVTFENGTDFIIQQEGIYHLSCHAQIQKTSGAAGEFVDMWYRLNGVDIPGTASRNSVVNNNDLKVLLCDVIKLLVVGDLIQVYCAVSNTGSGLGLYMFTNGVGPVVPSVELFMVKLN